MNPPFTRSVGGDLLFGSLPQAERRRLQDELSRRLKARQASATAGLGAAFVAAAAPKLRPGEGRLALVLPATVCTGPSWEQTRVLIQQNFALDMVITSHDPLRWNFSDSTGLSEALLIATRRPEQSGGAERRTVFANLWRNPDGVLDALRTAQAIAATPPAPVESAGTALLEIDGQHVGELVSMPESAFSYDRWPGVQFARADVLRSALRLLDEGMMAIPGESDTAKVPLCRLTYLGQVGPDRRDLWDGFQATDIVTAYPMVENHDTEVVRSIATEPSKYLSPLVEPGPGRRLKSTSQLWQRAGQLLIAERLWLNTTRVIAMHTGRPVLSNVWWPVRTERRDWEKALALWLNGSLGLLTLLAHRTSTRGGWVALKKADLEVLPVLDARALAPAQLQALSELFDEIAGDGVPAAARDGRLPGPPRPGRRPLRHPQPPRPVCPAPAAGDGAGGLQPAAVGGISPKAHAPTPAARPATTLAGAPGWANPRRSWLANRLVRRFPQPGGAPLLSPQPPIASVEAD